MHSSSWCQRKRWLNLHTWWDRTTFYIITLIVIITLTVGGVNNLQCQWTICKIKHFHFEWEKVLYSPYALTTLDKASAAPCLTDGILSCRLLKKRGYKAGKDDLKYTSHYHLVTYSLKYSEVPILRPQIMLVKIGLNI